MTVLEFLKANDAETIAREVMLSENTYFDALFDVVNLASTSYFDCKRNGCEYLKGYWESNVGHQYYCRRLENECPYNIDLDEIGVKYVTKLLNEEM